MNVVTEEIAKHFALQLEKYFGYGTFTVYEPGFQTDSDCWTIGAEDGPEDWAYRIGNASKAVAEVYGTGKLNFWCEAVNHWCIALIPND